MSHALRPLATAALSLALCATVRAQDSVGLPPHLIHPVTGPPGGDAVNAHDVLEQQNDYIVDKAALHSSWGNAFSVAPVIKASKQRDTPLPLDFFSMSVSAQEISRLTKSNSAFVRNSYMLWNGQGFGVNHDTALNTAGVPVDTTGMSGFQVGVAFAEFGTGGTDPGGNPASLNNVIGGLVNFTASLPSRLYVTRVVAAVNGPGDDCTLAQFGAGSLDEVGNLHFRADNASAASCGTFGPMPLNDVFRVRLLARSSSTVNVINALGGNDAIATDWLLVGDANPFSAPNMIPSSLAGRPVAYGLNFVEQFGGEHTAGSPIALSVAGTHFAAGGSQQRGAIAYHPRVFATLMPGSTSGTAAHLCKVGALTDSINFFGLDANGNFQSPMLRTLPATVSDPAQPAWVNTALGGNQQLDHYHSASFFRAGSQVALGKDQAGRLLAAATVYYGAPLNSNTNPSNYIAVVRTDPTTGASTWSAAAWTQEQSGFPSDGKTIFQNGTTPIGRLSGAPLGTLSGPALSAPMIDSVGNVWFVGEIALTSPAMTGYGLLRAVYDPAAFSYKLELVLKEGDVLPGRNSGTNYQVKYLSVAGANAVSPSTAWSNNISASADMNVSAASLALTDPRTMGGLVIAATIVYDVDNDGQFIRQTGTGGVATSVDEDYQVLLLVSASKDCNNNGIPDDRDLFDGTVSDVNGDGIPDSCQGITGVAFCVPGQGGVTPCVCGNPNAPGAGCANTGSSGANIASAGLPSLAADTVVLTGTSMLSGSTCIFLQGNVLVPTGAAFGAGQRCAGGSLKRLYVKTLNGMGGTQSGPQVGDATISARSAALGDVIGAGQTRYYQIYYRDPSIPNPGGSCPTNATFNITSGQRIQWLP